MDIAKIWLEKWRHIVNAWAQTLLLNLEVSGSWTLV